MGRQSNLRRARRETRPDPGANGTWPPAWVIIGRQVWDAVLRVAASPWFLPTVLLVAAALRLGHLWFLRESPFFAHLQLDPRAYDEWAQRIAAGDWLGRGAFFVDPLYAYFLAGLYKIFGHDLLSVRLVQVLLGVGTCWLTARLGRRVLGSAGLGNLASVVVVLFLPAVHYEATIEKTALSVFLFTLALVLFLERSARTILGSGVALGLAVLTRGNFLLLVPAGAALLGLDRGRGEAIPWRRVGLFLVGALAVVGLATVHNWKASGELVLTTSNLGQNLYIGQHRGNEVGTYAAPDFVRPDPRYEEDDFRAEAERRLRRTLTAGEVSSYWRDQALGEMAAAPPATVGRTWRKLRLLSHQYEMPDNDNIELTADYSPVLRLPLPGMGLLFPLALLGGLVGWRRHKDVRVLVGAAAIYLASVMAFFVLSRFRVQIVPIFAVLAVAALAWLADAALHRARPRLMPALLLVGVVATSSLVLPSWLAQKRRSALAIASHNLGAQFVEAGDIDGGLRFYERAVATDPASVLASMRQLGDLYLKRHDYEAAERHMRRVVEFKPQSRLGWEALVRLYETMLVDERYGDDASLREKLATAYRGAGRPADADRLDGGQSASASTSDADQAQALYRESREWREQGHWPEAIATLERAISVGPYDENARYTLGGLMEKHASPDEMAAYWMADAASDPKPQTSYYFWAVALERKGDLEGAIAKLERALEIDPAHEMSENRWGQILEKQERLEDALAHYRLATEILPTFQDAHQNCARLLSRLGRQSEAEEQLARARAAATSTTRPYVHWARYLLKSGRQAAAIAELERALRENPNDAEARQLLAEAR